MPKIPFKFSRYLKALLLFWISYLMLLMWLNTGRPGWKEDLRLWSIVIFLILMANAASLPHRLYRRAADAVTNALANFFRLSRSIQVCCAFALSLLLLEGLMLLLPVLQNHWHLDKKFWETGAFWTSAMLLVSAPVAFVVWRFRDENQSKDINLKEFQKISEWVTGAHFQDAKQGETLSGSLPENVDTALHSFSKQDGAVGLQIAAVYNLLPFYRGDYGQAFEKPSVHLLHSAWKVLQHDILQKLDNADDETRKDLIKQLRQRADSPLGQAITRVLLACDYAKKPLLHRHLEILPGICLSGMDFELAGLETEILRENLFCGQDLTGAQWQGLRGVWGWNLSQAVLNSANLSGAGLHRAKLSGAGLNSANLSDSRLGGANLSSAELDWANLSGAELYSANLSGAELYRANLSGAELYSANLSGAGLDEANLSNARLNSANLSNARLRYAENLTAEQLLVTERLTGSLTDADNFSQYTQPEQQQLQGKGLIVLHKGNDTIRKYFFCRHKNEKFWRGRYFSCTPPSSIDLATILVANPDRYISIDLAATRAANPDWEISIE